MVKIVGIIIILLALLFLLDHTFEYRYWKKTQDEAFSFIKNVVSDLKSCKHEDIEDDVTSLQLLFESSIKGSFGHNRVEKLARMYILNDFLHHNQNAFEFSSRYIKPEEGLAPRCHFDLLIVLYQKEMGLPQNMLTDPAFNTFCQGWNKLDREFGFWNSPHGRKELRY